MRRQRVNKTQLARLLNVHLPQVDRLLDLKHGSKVDQLEAAANALGRRLEVSLADPETVIRVPRVHAGVLAAQKRKRHRLAAGAKKK